LLLSVMVVVHASVAMSVVNLDSVMVAPEKPAPKPASNTSTSKSPATLRTKPKANNTAGAPTINATVDKLGVKYDELKAMSRHGGEQTEKHFQKLDVLLTTEKANITISEMPKMEAAAAKLITSYLRNTKLEADPQVESTRAASKKDAKAVQRLARKKAILKQDVKIEKSERRGAAKRTKYAKKIRADAELVVKDAAKKQGVVNRQYQKAVKRSKKSRMKSGRKSEADNHALKLAEMKNRVSNLVLQRDEALLAKQTEAYMTASEKSQDLKVAVASRTSQEKATSVAEAVTVKAAKRAVKLENRAKRQSGNTIKESAIQHAVNKVGKSEVKTDKKLSVMKKKVTKAIKEAKKSGSPDAQEKADKLSAKYEGLTAKSLNRKEELEALKTKRFAVNLQVANAAAARTEHQEQARLRNLTQLGTKLKVAKIRSEKAGRAVQRGMVAAQNSTSSAGIKKMKNSMKHLQAMQEQVVSLQKSVAEKSGRVVHYKKEHTKAVARQKKAQKAADQKKDMANLDTILQDVMAKAQTAQINSAPGIVAVKKQAQTLARGRYKHRRQDQARMKKVEKGLVEARKKQMSAAKLMPKAIRQYMIKARTTAPQKQVDAVSLDVMKKITALQNTQVKVESLKAKKDRLSKKLQQDDAKAERKVEKSTAKLEQKIETTKAKNANKTSILQSINMTSLSNTTQLRVADREVRDRKQLVAQAESRVDDLADQVKTIGKQIIKAAKEGDQTKLDVLDSDRNKTKAKLTGARVAAKTAVKAEGKAKVQHDAVKEAFEVGKAAIQQVIDGAKPKPDDTPLDFASTKLSDAAMLKTPAQSSAAMLKVLNERIDTTMKAVKDPANKDRLNLNFASLPLAKSAMGTNETATLKLLNEQIATTLSRPPTHKTTANLTKAEPKVAKKSTKKFKPRKETKKVNLLAHMIETNQTEVHEFSQHE